MPNDAVNRTPTVDEQIGSFKGYSTKDGEVVGAQESRPLGGAVDNETETGLGYEEGDQGQQPQGQPQTPNQQQPSRKQKSAQERIDQAVSRQRVAERRADQAEARAAAQEARLAALEARANGQALTNGQAHTNGHDPNAPDPAKYQYGELDSRYVADLARYEAQKVIEASNARTAEANRAQQIEAHKTKVDDFAVKGAEKYEDFRDVVVDTATRNEWPLTRTVGELAMDSEHGHDILYALAQDYKEAERVAKLTPPQQARWFGIQEAKWSAASPAANRGQRGQSQRQPAQRGQNDQGQQSQTVRTTQAPQPYTRVPGSGNVQQVSPDTTDFAAFEAMAQGSLRGH